MHKWMPSTRGCRDGSALPALAWACILAPWPPHTRWRQPAGTPRPQKRTARGQSALQGCPRRTGSGWARLPRSRGIDTVRGRCGGTAGRQEGQAELGGRGAGRSSWLGIWAGVPTPPVCPAHDQAGHTHLHAVAIGGQAEEYVALLTGAPILGAPAEQGRKNGAFAASRARPEDGWPQRPVLPRRLAPVAAATTT